MHLRRTLGIGLGLFAAAAFALAQQPAAPTAPPTENLPAGGAAAPAASGLKSLKERSSYAIGVDIGRGLKGQGLDIDNALLARGISDALAGNKSLMSDQEVKQTMIELQRVVEMQQKALEAKFAERNKKVGEKNKIDGPIFLAANKNREGVKTLPSGLQYKVLKEGKGATPKATDLVTTNYRGTLLDGTEFDDSAKHGGPQTFPVDHVIAGWTEALQLMKEGDKWQLFVPANLAYGEHGFPPDIAPNATLIFETELLKTQPAPAGAADEKPQQ